MTGTRVLYISDSIGLGHAARDLAIARELRALNPEVEIMWLAGDPAKKLIAESPRTVPGEPPSSSMISWSRERRHGRRARDQYPWGLDPAWHTPLAGRG
jgi:hypothetical protein